MDIDLHQHRYYLRPCLGRYHRGCACRIIEVNEHLSIIIVAVVVAVVIVVVIHVTLVVVDIMVIVFLCSVL